MELTKEVLAEIQNEAGRHVAIAVNEDWKRAYDRLADAAEHLALRMDKYWRTPPIPQKTAHAPPKISSRERRGGCDPLT